jgi:hypothetical protein
VNFPTIQKEKEDFNQQFFEEEILQPLVETNQTNLMADSQENGYLKEVGRKIFPNLLIIVGGYFLFVTSAVLFYNFVLNPPSGITNPWRQLIYLIGGFFLLFLNLGKIKKKSNWLQYALIPLMGIVFGILFNLVPIDWRIPNAFGYSLMLIYPLALFVFYYIKGYFESSVD